MSFSANDCCAKHIQLSSARPLHPTGSWYSSSQERVRPRDPGQGKRICIAGPAEESSNVPSDADLIDINGQGRTRTRKSDCRAGRIPERCVLSTSKHRCGRRADSAAK
nr:hypothetical protein CFP56_01079 [Quercus suber]